jgi:glycine/D-amino acid oxidase-like deaminating enzyme
MADVVIIGAGLTGCATAYACAVAGLKVVVIERERVGQGSAGRSAGLLLPDPGPTFREVAGTHGLRAARRVFEAWRRGSLDAAAMIRRLGIKCGIEAHDAVVVAARDDERHLRREYEARVEAGLEVSWLNQTQVRTATALEATAGMRLRDAFTFDPYRACVGTAAAAVRRGAKIFERSHVSTVRFSRKDVEVLAAGGLVRAANVIVTTGLATREFAPLRRHFKPREAYLVLTEALPAAIRKQLGKREAIIRDLRTPTHRLRWTKDDQILIGGADQEATSSRNRQAVLIQRTGQLMYELLTMYPAISGLRPAYGWELSYGETADGLMYIGPHRNYPHHFFALGGRSDSVSGAFLAARILVRALQGAPDKADEVFSWVR